MNLRKIGKWLTTDENLGLGKFWALMALAERQVANTFGELPGQVIVSVSYHQKPFINLIFLSMG